MKTQFDIEEILELGEIQNALDFERGLIADRKLRVLFKKKIQSMKTLRK